MPSSLRRVLGLPALLTLGDTLGDRRIQNDDFQTSCRDAQTAPFKHPEKLTP
jgi:hypothetical protein